MFTTKLAVIEPSWVVVITLCHEIYESNLLEWNRLSSSRFCERLLSTITLKSKYTYAGFVFQPRHEIDLTTEKETAELKSVKGTNGRKKRTGEKGKGVDEKREESFR